MIADDLAPLIVSMICQFFLPIQNPLMDEEMMEVLFDDRPADEQMFVISNTSKVNGAASMFYEDVLSDLAEKMGTNLYILPSSIHESIAVSAKMGNPEHLAEMVAEINAGQVTPEEQLSDHVYLFNAEEKTLTLADTSTQGVILLIRGIYCLIRGCIPLKESAKNLSA